ncbi:bifunctional 5,10-methylenetetrahydrofolate dehydrogenase/5,10-methenyltetrahydrofolate cyclohydrolase [Candidatus Saccharibacteria bacterium]|nr:bifunctional 5,10-methylenetetrahydrofolate dehydrogenase/5,10-methenyltetrahydrofolate cyclohydrolase [Candidatus Saccharibacteria bacterium]
MAAVDTVSGVPTLLILKDHDDPVIDLYVRKKVEYAESLGARAVVKKLPVEEMAGEIERANGNTEIRGMIVQLPLLDRGATDELVAKIAPEKDVDGLAGGRPTATAAAVDRWVRERLTESELAGRRIAVVGRGRLVGAPLAKLWREQGLDVDVFTSKDAARLPEELPKYDLIVMATGVPGVLKAEMVSPGTLVVDAGTATDSGEVKGDVADEVRALPGVTVTPKVGGIGPMTVRVLFERLLEAV